MKIVSPRGVVVSVRDEKAEQLFKEGWTKHEGHKPERPAAKRAARKTDKDKAE